MEARRLRRRRNSTRRRCPTVLRPRRHHRTCRCSHRRDSRNSSITSGEETRSMAAAQRLAARAIIVFQIFCLRIDQKPL